MNSPRTIRSLGVAAPGRPFIFEYEDGPLDEGQFRVDTLYTGFSAGTELTFVKGTNPYLHARWDRELGLFIPGEPGARYPVPFLGYMEVGRISETRTPAYGEGALIALTYGHKTGHTAHALNDLAVALPAEIDPLLGIYVAQMGPIAANGLLHAAAELVGTDVRRLGDGVAGRTVLVIGAGVVGLMTALFAAENEAAEVVIADPSPFRRKRAAALGFEAVSEGEAWRLAKARWSHGDGDRGADVVFQARARPESLHAGLRAARPQGAVIDLSFYQGGAEALRLGEEFHHNGLTIRCAQIGRPPKGLGFVWDRRRLALETISLLRARGDAILRHMVTHVVPFEKAPNFLLDVVEHRPDFLQIVFEIRT